MLFNIELWFVKKLNVIPKGISLGIWKSVRKAFEGKEVFGRKSEEFRSVLFEVISAILTGRVACPGLPLKLDEQPESLVPCSRRERLAHRNLVQHQGYESA